MEPTTQQTVVANSTPAIIKNSSFDKKQLITPIAIIVAGALIAFGLYTKGGSQSNVNGKNLINGALAEPKVEVAKVTDADHIRGNKDAKVVIIEYSDIECPFCKI